MTSKFNKVLAVSMLMLVALASVAFSVTPMEANAARDGEAITLVQNDSRIVFDEPNPLVVVGEN